MYPSTRISGYRSLESFELVGLERINLLVGTNNCGKTSILECIELLRSSGDLSDHSSILGRRAEWGYTSDEECRANLDVSRLFANRDPHRGVVIEADRVGAASSSAWNNRFTVSTRP